MTYGPSVRPAERPRTRLPVGRRPSTPGVRWSRGARWNEPLDQIEFNGTSEYRWAGSWRSTPGRAVDHDLADRRVGADVVRAEPIAPGGDLPKHVAAFLRNTARVGQHAPDRRRDDRAGDVGSVGERVTMRDPVARRAHRTESRLASTRATAGSTTRRQTSTPSAASTSATRKARPGSSSRPAECRPRSRPARRTRGNARNTTTSTASGGRSSVTPASITTTGPAPARRLQRQADPRRHRPARQ